MAGISHQNLNWLVQAYCQGSLLQIKNQGYRVQLVFRQFCTWKENGKKRGFNKRFMFLIGGAREGRDGGMIREQGEQVCCWDGWPSRLTLIWAGALTNVTICEEEFGGLFAGWKGEEDGSALAPLLKGEVSLPSWRQSQLTKSRGLNGNRKLSVYVWKDFF